MLFSASNRQSRAVGYLPQWRSLTDALNIDNAKSGFQLQERSQLFAPGHSRSDEIERAR
jgi:hypothetical protein